MRHWLQEVGKLLWGTTSLFLSHLTIIHSFSLPPPVIFSLFLVNWKELNDVRKVVEINKCCVEHGVTIPSNKRHQMTYCSTLVWARVWDLIAISEHNELESLFTDNFFLCVNCQLCWLAPHHKVKRKNMALISCLYKATCLCLWLEWEDAVPHWTALVSVLLWEMDRSVL